MHEQLRADELKSVKLKRPQGMLADTPVDLSGGGVLVFSEFGQVKFHVKSRVRSEKQQRRINSLWERGYYDAPERTKDFASLHLSRATRWATGRREGWR